VHDNQESSGEQARGQVAQIAAWIGAAIGRDDRDAGFHWLRTRPEIESLIVLSVSRYDDVYAQLPMEGWRRYEAIKHAEVASRTAFMAMKFGDEELTQAVENHFKPAVDRAGFELRLLSDGQPAGLIDDQLRVRLRTSRFTIADVTHANNGAYWEAGFAEGLGRPVIYTCRQEEWRERKVHFDTNHLLTIIWDPANLNKAAADLTATIRATLPSEAKMTD
jgi:hypothetical protein